MSKPKETKHTQATQKPAQDVGEMATQLTVEPPRKPRKQWSMGGVFWGLLLVLIGVLILLNNLDLVEVDFSNLWLLWPILIIGAGLSVLSLKGWLSAIVSFLLIIAMLILVGVTSVENSFISLPSGKQVETVMNDFSASSTERVDLNVKSGALEMDIASYRETETASAKLSSNIMKLTQTSELKNGTRYITLSTLSDNNFRVGNPKNVLSIDLTQRLPLSLTINSGASDIKGDLSEVMLDSLTLKTGASNIDLKLGSIQPKQDVTLESGASSIKLLIPSEAGVRVKTTRGLSSTEFESIDKVDDGLYESEGYNSSAKKIDISAKLGVSSFRIERY